MRSQGALASTQLFATYPCIRTIAACQMLRVRIMGGPHVCFVAAVIEGPQTCCVAACQMLCVSCVCMYTWGLLGHSGWVARHTGARGSNIAAVFGALVVQSIILTQVSD